MTGIVFNPNSQRQDIALQEGVVSGVKNTAEVASTGCPVVALRWHVPLAVCSPGLTGGVVQSYLDRAKAAGQTLRLVFYIDRAGTSTGMEFRITAEANNVLQDSDKGTSRPQPKKRPTENIDHSDSQPPGQKKRHTM